MSGAVTAEAVTPAAIFRKAREDGRTALFEHEVYALLGAAAFDVPRHVFWNGAPGPVPTEIEDFLEGLRGDDVVLKIVSPDLAHKSDVGGISFSKKSPASVIAAARTMWEDVSRRAPAAQRLGILVVEKLVPASGTPAAEALLSFKHDPAFGPVLVFGLGGVLTEWYGANGAGGDDRDPAARGGEAGPPGRSRKESGAEDFL